jgi:hypothetical protein
MSETTCPDCGAADFIQIRLSLPDGSDIHFCSCHRCETRWWNQDGQSLGLDEVLELARSRDD